MSSRWELDDGIESIKSAWRHEHTARTNLEKMLKNVEAENAKLRKLVHTLLQCHVENADTCAKCECRSPLHGGCMADVKADELGVEVE